MKLAFAFALINLACAPAPDYEPECGPRDDTRAHCPGPDCADAWRVRLDCLTDYGADLRIEGCLADCDIYSPTPSPCSDNCR